LRSTKTHVAHRRMKIERVHRPYLTARRLVYGIGSTTYLVGVVNGFVDVHYRWSELLRVH
jgi:hypothetical protein